MRLVEMNATDQAIAADAAIRLGVDAAEITVCRHEQVFGSTAVGFPGMGGAAMTPAQVAVALAGSGGACVYVADRLCYLISLANDTFAADLERRALIDASRYTGQYDQLPQPAVELFRLKESKREATTFRKALDLAYDRARPGYGIKRAAKPATVVRDSDGEVICRLTPVEDGARSPEYEFTDAAKPYQFDGRFPRIGEPS